MYSNDVTGRRGGRSRQRLPPREREGGGEVHSTALTASPSASTTCTKFDHRSDASVTSPPAPPAPGHGALGHPRDTRLETSFTNSPSTIPPATNQWSRSRYDQPDPSSYPCTSSTQRNRPETHSTSESAGSAEQTAPGSVQKSMEGKRAGRPSVAARAPR